MFKKKPLKYFFYDHNNVMDFIMRQVKFAHQEMANQMKMMQEFMQTLENDNIFEILTTIEIWHKKKI